ncbi:hypothetical protein HDU96_001126 [Phlyctochytrium bullatum]|nr:hypothetical protein HDU96_001126 [Phlyctochytrium bullatum]
MKPLSGAGPASMTAPLLAQRGSTQKQNASTSVQSSAPSSQSASGGVHVQKKRQTAMSFSPKAVSKFASLMARETTVKAVFDQRPQRMADTTTTNATLPLAFASLLSTPEKPRTSERFQKWTYAEVVLAAPRPAGLAATSPQLQRAPKRAGSSAWSSAAIKKQVKTPPHASKRARREDLSPGTEDRADDGPWVLVGHKRRGAKTASPRRTLVADATLTATPKKSVIKMAGFTPTPVMESKGKFLDYSADLKEQSALIRLQMARDEEFAKELQVEDSISWEIASDKEFAKALQAEEEDKSTSLIHMLTQQHGLSRKGKERVKSRWPPINQQGLRVQEVPSTGLGTDGIPGTLATSSRPPKVSGNIPRTLGNPGWAASHLLELARKHKVMETVEKVKPDSLGDFGGLS